MNKKRVSSLDFSKHVVTVEKQEGLLIHTLAIPGTITQSVKFINTQGIMAVTGDYGNWIFCREFHPSPTGSVSDSYWCEKLRISSRQDPYEFDSNTDQFYYPYEVRKNGDKTIYIYFNQTMTGFCLTKFIYHNHTLID